jgi:hypothetical protein
LGRLTEVLVHYVPLLSSRWMSTSSSLSSSFLTSLNSLQQGSRQQMVILRCGGPQLQCKLPNLHAAGQSACLLLHSRANEFQCCLEVPGVQMQASQPELNALAEECTLLCFGPFNLLLADLDLPTRTPTTQQVHTRFTHCSSCDWASNWDNYHMPLPRSDHTPPAAPWTLEPWQCCR